MEKLKPFEKLDDDYYTGATAWRDEDSADDMSSDDELQAELRKLAGIPRCDKKSGEPKSEFEDDMENQLDRSICDYVDEHMGGKLSHCTFSKIEALPTNDVEMANTASNSSDPSSSKPSADDGANNPIKTLADKAKKDVEKEEVEFYDPEEDELNEKWVEERSRKSRGESSTMRGKIDNDSDAVLSCPGCMNLLTRDCQRHEIYKDQYRAMFVENCNVDMQDKLTIEKTGKDQRRKRQKMKKTGFNQSTPENDDIFYPVRCTVCKTKVAVMDTDEVYHFFNVLSGYS